MLPWTGSQTPGHPTALALDTCPRRLPAGDGRGGTSHVQERWGPGGLRVRGPGYPNLKLRARQMQDAREQQGKPLPHPREPRGKHRENAARGTPPTQKKKKVPLGQERKQRQSSNPTKTRTRYTHQDHRHRQDKKRENTEPETSDDDEKKKKQQVRGYAWVKVKRKTYGSRAKSMSGMKKHKGNPKPERFGVPQRLREREREKEREREMREREKERERERERTHGGDEQTIQEQEEDKQIETRHGSGREGLKEPKKTNTDLWEITTAAQRTGKKTWRAKNKSPTETTTTSQGNSHRRVEGPMGRPAFSWRVTPGDHGTEGSEDPPTMVTAPSGAIPKQHARHIAQTQEGSWVRLLAGPLKPTWQQKSLPKTYQDRKADTIPNTKAELTRI